MLSILRKPKMKIHVRKNAATVYRKRCSYGPYTFNPDWFFKLQKIEDQDIEVNTQYLFVDQFNTVPISNVSTEGLRIENHLVDHILNDERFGKGSCLHCGKVLILEAFKGIPKDKRSCPKCGAIGHIQSLISSKSF